MYAVAAALDPDSYHQLARAVFGEMLLAGITCVGEFHYLHHQADGGSYEDPNAMGAVVMAAAADAGIRLTLLDAVYLTGDLGDTIEQPRLNEVQQRFSDRSVDDWAGRVAGLTEGVESKEVQIGGAIHSVRAVPPAQMAAVVKRLRDLPHTSGDARVLHAHVAEQPAEVSRAQEAHGASPVRLFADAGAVGPQFTAVHGVWLNDDDIGVLGAAGATVCACPTTERDLADGVVPAGRLHVAGAGLALGTDQHAVIDLFEEGRGVELDLRLSTQVRGTLDPGVLLEAATAGGARSLGWSGTGRIRAGMLADLCVVGLDSVRLAGLPREALAGGIVFAAIAADVTHTIVGGRVVVADGRHHDLDVPSELAETIALTKDRSTT
jgi:formiminoglutamate deiminase